MYQRFTRPDLYAARSGRLDAVVTENRIDGAPPFMKGLRALFVSDVHVLDRTLDREIAALAAKIAALAPELLLLGGDYSDTARNAARLFRALEGLTPPPLGAFAVLGNNDAEAWAGNRRALRRALERMNCRLLVNESARLSRGGGRLWIAGVDEHLYGAPDARGLYPARPGQDRYRLLLSHYPRPAQPAPDLMLSGHTHGGQFNLLGVTPFTVGFERLKPPRLPALAVAGLRQAAGCRLLVSKGIGASRIQLRLGVRPEINLLEFL